MGNCCKGASSSSSAAVWAGDDWEECVNQDSTVLFDATAAEKKRLLPAHGTSSSSSSGTGREVKIKISRKELEELMSRAEELGLSSEQVLARLIFSDEQSHNNNNTSLVFHDMMQAELDHHRHWKPALQSIPELN